jgi:hypothetical protein
MSSVADIFLARIASAIDEAVADSAENGGGGFFNVDCMSLLLYFQGSLLPRGQGKPSRPEGGLLGLVAVCGQAGRARATPVSVLPSNPLECDCGSTRLGEAAVMFLAPLKPVACGVLVVVLGVSLHAQPPASIFQGAMTSSGKNRPSISLAQDDLLTLSALLHRRVPRRDMQLRLGISEEELQRRLDLLLGEGLAKARPNGDILPTSMVVTFEDARTYFRPDDRLVEAAARLLLRKLPAVKAQCRTLLADAPWDLMSFFVMSDVLLDNWQIANIERLFVKAERTFRTGGRYYYTILEKAAADPSEPFGLYGNTGSQWGTVQVGLYGNDRFSGRTLLSIPDAAFNAMFGFPEEMSPREARQHLADRMVEALRGNAAALDAAQRQTLAQLGLATDNTLNVLLLQEDDYKALDRVAALVTADLVKLLARNRTRILATYHASPYAEEATPNEYLLCWYHFFYAAVTNRLRDKGAIHIPAKGTVTYFVVP